jgi:cytochrome c oxidase subunit II
VSAPTTRAERRAAALGEHRAHRSRGHAAERAARRRRDQIGKIAFGAVITVVLAVGGYLAFGDFLGRGGVPVANAISVQASMAGFTPSEIHVKAGEAVTLDFWTQDNPLHLRGGVHTMISHELGLHEELPGATAAGTSRVTVAFTAPATPGTYDIYCDTCCGGKDSPTMHGKVIVDAA